MIYACYKCGCYMLVANNCRILFYFLETFLLYQFSFNSTFHYITFSLSLKRKFPQTQSGDCCIWNTYNPPWRKAFCKYEIFFFLTKRSQKRYFLDRTMSWDLYLRLIRCLRKDKLYNMGHLSMKFQRKKGEKKGNKKNVRF